MKSLLIFLLTFFSLNVNAQHTILVDSDREWIRKVIFVKSDSKASKDSFNKYKGYAKLASLANDFLLDLSNKINTEEVLRSISGLPNGAVYVIQVNQYLTPENQKYPGHIIPLGVGESLQDVLADQMLRKDKGMFKVTPPDVAYQPGVKNIGYYLEYKNQNDTLILTRETNMEWAESGANALYRQMVLEKGTGMFSQLQNTPEPLQNAQYWYQLISDWNDHLQKQEIEEFKKAIKEYELLENEFNKSYARYHELAAAEARYSSFRNITSSFLNAGKSYSELFEKTFTQSQIKESKVDLDRVSELKENSWKDTISTYRQMKYQQDFLDNKRVINKMPLSPKTTMTRPERVLLP